MLRKVLFVIGALLLVGVLVGAGLSRGVARAQGGTIVLEPWAVELDSGDENFETVVLEPIQPGDEGWTVESEPVAQGEAVNGIVRGPSNETGYRCVVLLEPVRPGEQFSKASEPVCSDGRVDTVNGVSLDSSYLIAKFYDRTNYTTLLVEYYGSSACSPTISYGVPDLPDNLDNRFASGQAYSNCDHIYVYDFNNSSGPSYSCGANCPSFYALNGEVSSWRTTD